MKKINYMLINVYKLFVLYLFFLLLFQVSRFVFLFSFSDTKSFDLAMSHIISIVFNGFRFDTVVSLYGLVPVLLLIFGYIIVSKKYLENYSYFVKKMTLKYSIFISFIFLSIISIDFFYFKTYNHHFDSLIFALKNDGTTAIAKTLWVDYPLLKIVLFILISVLITKKTIEYLLDKEPWFTLKKISINLIAIVLFIGSYFLGLRGSIGMFPLQRKHAFKTEHLFSNQMTLNSVFALKSALAEGDNAGRINADYTKSLKKYNFNSIEEALSIYLKKEISNKESVLDSLMFTKTKKNTFLEKNPPHVVFILMESFGQHLFNLNNEKCNTLGTLESQLPYCHVFNNFLSSGNYTINSLENILVGTALSPLSQSAYKNKPLPSSVVIPFKKSGYFSSFLYSGEYAWRNVGEYVTTQGFDNVYTQSSFEVSYQNPEKNPWGVQDEYLYDKLFKLLSKSKKQQFVFTLTISNHTPYKLPNSFHPKPVFFNDSLLNKMKIDKELTYKSIHAYQYASDQLGQFIKKIRESELGQNTIIAVTGDHNSHQGFKYEENESFIAHAVPFLLYIPKKYEAGFFNEKQFGSHKDIFPTLFNLSLSDTDYFKTGENLFDHPTSFSINDFKFAANEFGAVELGNPPKFFNWNLNRTQLTKTNKNYYLDSLSLNMKAYNAIMHYYIQKEF